MFATLPIAPGEVLDAGPLMLVPTTELEGTLLGWYVFEHTDDDCLLCLGRVSLMNHSCDPNAVVEICTEAQDYAVIALRDIAPGTEILIDYGPDYGLVGLEG